MDYQHLSIETQGHLVTCTMLNPPSHTMAAAIEFAVMLSKRAPRALAHAKRAIGEGAESSLEQGLDRPAELLAELIRTEDAGMAMKAMLAGKQAPAFKGR